MRRKVAITVSAMMLAAHMGSPAAAAEPNVNQLAAINRYLESNQIEELRAFLQINPELLEGEGRLAVLLREFMSESSDLTTYLGFEPQLRDFARESPTGGDIVASPRDRDFEPAAGALY